MKPIGGWTLSATWLGQGGNPFTPYMLSSSNSYAGQRWIELPGFQWYLNQVAANPKSGSSRHHRSLVQYQCVCGTHSRDAGQYAS